MPQRELLSPAAATGASKVGPRLRLRAAAAALKIRCVSVGVSTHLRNAQSSVTIPENPLDLPRSSCVGLTANSSPEPLSGDRSDGAEQLSRCPPVGRQTHQRPQDYSLFQDVRNKAATTGAPRRLNCRCVRLFCFGALCCPGLTTNSGSAVMCACSYCPYCQAAISALQSLGVSDLVSRRLRVTLC